MHGGDYAAAAADPNAPRLFLIDQDDYVESGNIPNEIETQPNIPTHVQPLPEEPAPYRYDPSPAEVIEERYQKLLKEYGIE
jgi:penicillin-binding protein 1A